MSPSPLSLLARGLLGAAVLAAATVFAEPPRTYPYPRPLPEPTAQKLPRWRGFNLLYKFNVGRQTPITLDEDGVAAKDFRLIASLGFNFARIPLDYRCWTVEGDWERLDEAKLREIDRLLVLGEKYGIHLALNFHRAPGYTVAKPAEARDLWTDPEAQRVCALHWAEFARRYRDVPNTRLSFNLFNEPSDVSEAAYFAVVKKMVDAIHAQDPRRLVLCDGLKYGAVPPTSLAQLGVALCTRGYQPVQISHYRASWVHGSDEWSVPMWPTPQLSAYFYGPTKKDLQSPLALAGPLGGATLTLRVASVSVRSVLRATAGDGRTLWEHTFVPGPGEGEWKKVVHRPEWKTYQNIYDKDYSFAIPAGVSRVELRNVDGDWLTVSSLTLEKDGRRWTLPTVTTWGLKHEGTLAFDPARGDAALSAPACLDRAWLRDHTYAAWRQASARGIGVMLGELGAFQHTPHAVVLRWMEDVLAVAQESGWGWAVWEFRGGFGVFESNRKDVTYETWEGLKLDRAMLDLLQRY